MTQAQINEDRMRADHKKYSHLIKESNRTYPHPEKMQTLKDMPNYWFSPLLREKYISYCVFYDRSPSQIMKMSDNNIVEDLQDKVTEYCQKTSPYLLQRSHDFSGKYYMQCFINMAYDYNINLDMDKCEPGALVPRNFFRLINHFRYIYTRLNSELKSKLGEIEYFTDDLITIVISYVY
jgi:hypothetical protein